MHPKEFARCPPSVSLSPLDANGGRLATPPKWSSCQGPKHHDESSKEPGHVGGHRDPGVSDQETRVIRRLAWQWCRSQQPICSGREIARRLGVSHAYIQKVLREFAANPNPDSRLSTALVAWNALPATSIHFLLRYGAATPFDSRRLVITPKLPVKLNHGE